MFQTTPDDPRITEMDPVQKMWMFENWLADENDKAELAKNHAYLLASFSHPEAVKSLLGKDSHVSTDEEFEETSKLVRQMIESEDSGVNSNSTKPQKRRRRVLKA